MARRGSGWRTCCGGSGQVPPAIGRDTLRRLDRPGRRQAIRALGALLVLGPAAWAGWRTLPWREWAADVRTATGEQRHLELADGTRLVLNTASAVDILYTPEQRVLWLRAGEILLTTGRDPSPVHRPFIVRTSQGTIRALGTRFMVRDESASIRVAVFDGAVEIQPRDAGAAAAVVPAGQQTVFNAHEVEPLATAEAASASWEQGMLAVRNWRLADLVDELARYRRGRPAVRPRGGRVTGFGRLPAGRYRRQPAPAGKDLARADQPGDARSGSRSRPARLLQTNRRSVDTFFRFVRCTG